MTRAKIIKRAYLLDIYANIRWIIFFDIFYRIVLAYKSKIKNVLRPWYFFYIYIHIYIFYYNTNTNLLFLTNHTLSFVNQIYRVVNYTHLAYPKKPDFDWNDYDFTTRSVSNDMRTFRTVEYRLRTIIKLYLHPLHRTVARETIECPINYSHKGIRHVENVRSHQ